MFFKFKASPLFLYIINHINPNTYINDGFVFFFYECMFISGHKAAVILMHVCGLCWGQGLQFKVKHDTHQADGGEGKRGGKEWGRAACETFAFTAHNNKKRKGKAERKKKQ